VKNILIQNEQNSQGTKIYKSKVELTIQLLLKKFILLLHEIFFTNLLKEFIRKTFFLPFF